MRFWTVHALPATERPATAPPAPAPTARWLLSRRQPQAGVAPRGGLALVPETVPLLAILLPLLWLLWHRCWLAALMFLLASLAIALLPLGPVAIWIGAGLHVLTGLSAQDIRRWTLARHGRAMVAVVAGANEDAAMFRLLAQHPDLARAAA